MGFPSPAADYTEKRLSLDGICNTNAPSVYLFKADFDAVQAGIKRGALLVCNSALEPVDGSVIAATIDGHFKLVRYRKVPRLHLEELNSPVRKIELTAEEGGAGENSILFGVITHIVNDARVKLEGV